MNTQNTPLNGIDTTNLDVLRPLEFKPGVKNYSGTFLSKAWDTEVKDGKLVKKDLVVKVELEEKNELKVQFVIERRYNMLPRGRGICDFKADMASYLGFKIDKDKKIDEFPKRFLANQSLVELDGKKVIVAYKKGRGNVGSFDRFLPVNTTPAAAPVATEAPANAASPVAAAVTA